MILYLAGGVSGNLKPAWNRMAKGEITPDAFLEALQNENFWRGGVKTLDSIRDFAHKRK